ncbi:hypothetical protein [Thioalkalivibrio sp. HL-Eb18]|uniref:hypothetical protein n=1 Tax=Thioalkalivibrio sp. HL-Eb18 TaxID=1266913 RepID=UPI00036E65C4|nr:hypothetical protein [Thioalkalivibrio sp. HL-Eb18]
MSDATSQARADLREFLGLVAADLSDTDIGPDARAQRMAAKVEKTEAGLAPLIVQARTDRAAYDACCALLDHFIQNDQPVPDNLLLMARDVMTGKQKRPTKRGRDSMKLYGRDSVVVTSVAIARQHVSALYAHGYNQRNTACAIVADALAEHGVMLSPDAIESVWKSRTGGKK